MYVCVLGEGVGSGEMKVESKIIPGSGDLWKNFGRGGGVGMEMEPLLVGGEQWRI